MNAVGPDEVKVSQRNILDFHILRKIVFVDEYDWNVRTCGTYEFDQYDIPAARYVVAYSEGVCVGGARLLPCDTSFVGTNGLPYTYMLNDFCHGSMAGQFPASKLSRELPIWGTSWEMTRFISKSAKATKLLLEAVNAYLAKVGATEVITISPIQMPHILRRLKFEAAVISEPVIYDDRAYVALSTSIRSLLPIAI
jgi:N-acyl-L-homoserine lactone synthetase